MVEIEKVEIIEKIAKYVWKDDKRLIPNPEAFSKTAEEVAKLIGERGREERASKNKSSQIRKYYDEIFKLNQRARSQGANWDVVLAQVHMIVAKVAYAKGRKLVTDEFEKLMRELIKSIETKEHLNVVTNFLEAFMAFYKVHGPN